MSGHESISLNFCLITIVAWPFYVIIMLLAAQICAGQAKKAFQEAAFYYQIIG